MSSSSVAAANRACASAGSQIRWGRGARATHTVVTDMLAALAVLLACVLTTSPSAAQSCTADDFAKAVDSSAARLRTFNAE